LDFQNWLRRHAVTLFFVLTYAITWVGIFAVTGFIRFQGQFVSFEPILMVFGVMLAAPGFSALALTAIGEGDLGLKVLAAYLMRWQVGLQWYIVAVFMVPLLVLGILLGLTVLVSPLFSPGFAPIGITVGIVVGFLEEIGWTGYALPRLRLKYSALGSALILGLLWGFWHILADFTGSAPGQEGVWIVNFLLSWVAPLVALRILMVWVYNNTRSLLLSQIMHASYAGTMFFLVPALSSDLALIYSATLTVVLWIAAGLVIALTGKELARRPARHKLAAA
jgi:uncharacterized protein